MRNISAHLRQFALWVALVLMSACQASTLPSLVSSGPAELATPEVPDPVVAFMAVSQAQQHLSEAVITFAQPFVPGDVPADGTLRAITFSGRKLATQVDWKATHDGRSRRHGIITVSLPEMAAEERILIGLYNTPGQPGAGDDPPSSVPPPQGLEVRVVLEINGEPYTASFQKLAAAGVDRVWLSGPLVTEWHVSGPVVSESGQPHERIWVQFYARRYPTSGKTRVEVIVENTWTFKPNPRNVTYDAHVFVEGEEVYTQQNLIHTDRARWRKVFWVSGEPEVYVRHDLNYLKATGTIPNYDPDLRVPESAVVEMYRYYLASDRDPMEISIVTNPMGMGGGRPDIGPLPNWTVLRLLTMDPRLIEVNRGIGSLAGSWPVHLRDEETGLPVSLVNHPMLTIHPNLLKWPKNPLPLADYGEYPNHLRPDASHQPSLAFVPYLLTGDYYFLEELQFWAAWNPLRTSPRYRDFDKGLMGWTQVRGQAWSLRTLGQVAYITPDDHPMKGYWQRQLQSNLAWYNAHYVNSPGINELGFLEGDVVYPDDEGLRRGIAPWQDDFFTWAMGYLVGLGFDKARPMLEFKARFPVGRMTAPGYCWVLAAIYQLNVRETEDGPFYKTFARAYQESVSREMAQAPCGSAKMAALLGESYKPGDMSGYPWSPQGFPANMQPALAVSVNAGVPKADRAWRIFMGRTTKPDYSTYANWAIVPRKR